MKIAVAQLQSLYGDIDGNITRHEQFMRRAADYEVELLVFPELSLTQYDAPGAGVMATTRDDPRFGRLQHLSDEFRLCICAGIPLAGDGGNTISMLIFQPGKPLEIYSKQYLHDDEKPFFIAGMARTPISSLSDDIAFAICYELSVPEHARAAYEHGASIYVASVAKTHSGVAKARQQLAQIGRDYRMTVFLSNCVGPCDGSTGGGQSAVWDVQGELLAQLSDTEEGFLLYNPQSPQPPEIVIIPTETPSSSRR